MLWSVFLVPLLAVVLFVVLAVLSASVLHAIGRGSFREGFRLLFVQCMGLFGAPLGLVAAWLAHAYVLVPTGTQVALWTALLAGTLLGGVAGVLVAFGALRVFGWLHRRVREPPPPPPPPLPDAVSESASPPARV